METQDWLILKVLFHTKNITKAAQTLFLSQPAITHRLRHMEEVGRPINKYRVIRKQATHA